MLATLLYIRDGGKNLLDTFQRGVFLGLNVLQKFIKQARHWWLMPVILATQEAEISQGK
jgi:hypothetical protein